MASTLELFGSLRKVFEGDIYTDEAIRILYSTDASAYREMPLAVCRPKNEADIKLLIDLALKNKLSLIPRTAGTSLAGQVVGNGIIVDVSKYFTQILDFNPEEKYIWVQPGIILDELNMFLKDYGLFFGPETSTSSRCMIGGMVGNNSCGAHSLIYGSTRNHLLSVKAILSDGSDVEFCEISKDEFLEKTKLNNLEGNIYRNIDILLSDVENQQNIINEFPDKTLERRNTGYAIDLLLQSEIFGKGDEKFNFCKLIAGSEGTLAFIKSIKLNLVDLPPKNKALIFVHLADVPQATRANIIALKYFPTSIELMDKAILDLTKENRLQEQNRFFVNGDPGAILIVEFAEESIETVKSKATAMEYEMRAANYGYYFPMIIGSDITKVWTLRKAGLGILSNMPGDAKPVPVIEDTAVAPKYLPDYIDEFDKILKQNNLQCVYYAHIATGELHLRPIINLKVDEGVKMFRKIAEETAKLVKKYHGSLSGEHGDGRLRGEFIPLMIGNENYQLIKEIKKCWDPNNIFNPGKITDTPPMDKFLRYEVGKIEKNIDTVFDFSSTLGYLRAIEKCNGTGDCRKTSKSGGVMCPSYMATLDEKNSTRARANTLREYISNSNKINPFDSKEIYESLDLCLSCKACKTECPSNVDMTKFKAEFLQHYYDSNGIPLRTKLIAYITNFNKLGALLPAVYNFLMSNKIISNLIKKSIGFAPKRSLPTLYKFTLKSWIQSNKQAISIEKGKVNLFIDEFTNFNDVEIGIAAIKLLNALGYQVQFPKHKLSGRTFLSKGLIRKAKSIANENVKLLKQHVSSDIPLIGIEPSAILSFRDEFIELVDSDLIEDARSIAKNALLFEEFFAREVEKGNINTDIFESEAKRIKLHGHCHQKATASTKPTIKMLSFPENYQVSEIPSGCCGMAGSFGFESEHFDLSMKIGEMVLFPEIMKMKKDEIIAAPGTSCRHQIKDGLHKKALHPIEIMFNALKK